MRIFNNQKGDTLTEVMFATAVAALVIVLALGAMNRSFAETQMAVETTFVRQSMDMQAELLRFARDQYKEDPGGSGGKLWRDVLAQSKPSATRFGTCYNRDPSQALDMPDKSFYITIAGDNLDVKSDAGNFIRPQTYADIGQGLWVEAIKGHENNGVTYLDLHIRACWEPPYSGPDATLGTIVRLYYEDK